VIILKLGDILITTKDKPLNISDFLNKKEEKNYDTSKGVDFDAGGALDEGATNDGCWHRQIQLDNIL
jgi:hypothetical protein